MKNLSYFKVGIFVITASVIAIIGVILLGVGSVFQKNFLVETYIDESVQGLDVGSPVKFRGVPIGKVEEISLTSVEYATTKRYVLVRTVISPKFVPRQPSAAKRFRSQSRNRARPAFAHGRSGAHRCRLSRSRLRRSTA
jgi:phospholipid/cholesterol/gamma-HCH transport system substrate-binding protein/paraquat-inducible protein B